LWGAPKVCLGISWPAKTTVAVSRHLASKKPGGEWPVPDAVSRIG